MTLARRVFVRSGEAAAAARLRELITVGRGMVPYSFVLSGETRATLWPGAGGSACAAVCWQPASGSAWPRFDGRVWPEAETLCSSWLRLEGRYGLANGAIDEIAERTADYRSARAVAKELLDELALGMARLHAAGRPERSQ